MDAGQERIKKRRRKGLPQQQEIGSVSQPGQCRTAQSTAGVCMDLPSAAFLHLGFAEVSVSQIGVLSD
jgi:hypothetical protein